MDGDGSGEGSGVAGPVDRTSVLQKCGVHIVDADGFRATIDAPPQGLTGEAVELRDHLASHPRLVARVGRYLTDGANLDHLRTDDLDHLIEIDVGLVVTPRGIEDVPDLETVRLLALARRSPCHSAQRRRPSKCSRILRSRAASFAKL